MSAAILGSKAHAGLDVDAAMVAAAAAYVEEKNTLMACPGTEQGDPGWYFSLEGEQVLYEVTSDAEGSECWVEVEKREMDTEGNWQDVSVTDAEQTKAFNWFRHAPRSLADQMAQSQLKWYGDRDRWQEPNQDVPQGGQSARQAAGSDESLTKVHSKTWFRKDVSAGVMANSDAAARIATEVADAAKQVEAAQATAQQAVATAQQTIQAQAQVQTQLTNQTAHAQLTNQTANAQVDLQITADGPNGWKSRLKVQPYVHPIVGDRKLVGRNSRFDEPEYAKR